MYIIVNAAGKKRRFLPWNQSEKKVREVVQAYEKNESFMLSGRVYYPSKIDKLTVFESDQAYRKLLLPNGRSPVGQKASFIAKNFRTHKVTGIKIVTNKFFKQPPKNMAPITGQLARDLMQNQIEIIAYCTQCGLSQGIFENNNDMRRKIAVQKKCPECGAVFGFLQDGRIWNLRWEELSSGEKETKEGEGAKIEKQIIPNQIVTEPELNKNIFIVHGRDHKPIKELMLLLDTLGFTPIVLFDQASAALTIAEKLEKYSEKIGFAFVLLTPDDLGAGPEEIKNPDNYQKRARQNVVLEFGYLMGKLGRDKICCLYKGDIELPSDMHGICYLHFNDSIYEIREMIVKELKRAYDRTT